MNKTRTIDLSPKEEYTAPEVSLISLSAENPFLSGFPIGDWEEE